LIIVEGNVTSYPYNQAYRKCSSYYDEITQVKCSLSRGDSRLEGGVNRAKLKFTNINTTTSQVSVRNKNESAREGAKQIASK
jgi:hypothetical protein